MLTAEGKIISNCREKIHQTLSLDFPTHCSYIRQHAKNCVIFGTVAATYPKVVMPFAQTEHMQGQKQQQISFRSWHFGINSLCADGQDGKFI